MNIVFFSHPDWLGSQSMPRYLMMLTEGMTRRGHYVKVLKPEPFLSRWLVHPSGKKWLGYIDQYLRFPLSVRKFIHDCSSDTLFVFADHALGPWVPIVADRPHVVHCHDFLAQKSAKGIIPENITGWTGRQYQSYIRKGYSRGKHFISVSRNTRNDLHAFLPGVPAHSEVVYNGLNLVYTPIESSKARAIISKHVGYDLSNGYVLHVGGNQWYKNRRGVIEIYNAWRTSSGTFLPLLMIGKGPDEKLKHTFNESPFRNDIHFVVGLDDTLMPSAYSGASLLLFPSIAEGFGWPIIEAMACGCPVVTTNEAPMTEVAGGAAFLIPVRPDTSEGNNSWANESAQVVSNLLELTKNRHYADFQKIGFQNVKRFNADSALDQIEGIYQDVLNAYKKKIRQSCSKNQSAFQKHNVVPA